MAINSTFIKDISELLYKFAERSRDVFWIRSADYRQQIYISAAYEKIWGRTCQSLIECPSHWNDYLHPEDKKRLNSSLHKRNEEIQPEENFLELYRIFRPNGEIRWIKDESFPIFNEHNILVGFAGIAQDVTENRLKEEELYREKQKAEVANQAKSDFIASMSHDFRTSLNGILGMATILQRENPTSYQAELIAGITQAGNNLLGLIENILDYSKVEAGELPLTCEIFNLKQLIIRSIEIIKITAEEKKLAIILNYPDSLLQKVSGDNRRIYRVLTNLLTNAVKFTHQGSIVVSVACLKQAVDMIEFEISIKDTGIGIPPEKLDYVFERFARMQPSYKSQDKGTGLGLTITKRLLTDMDGSIRVESQLGQGSNFIINFTLKPIVDTMIEETESRDTSLLESKNLRVEGKFIKRRLRALLIEDDLLSQKITKYLLTELNCNVDIVENCRSVMQNLNNLLNYDLIVTDIGLPDGDGMTLANQMRQFLQKNKKNIPIIALTAHVSEREQVQSIKLGINYFLKKPISALDFKKVLAKLSLSD